ncbi:branched-chain amino acid ABC transporter permease [Candidatus Xianfuyuplasma coldseepsis]|uniref:Branched-chain amino acid ABC transporter permease n=1 Tax=Candidatus Xianfuyuplasma coldseepsis TaxID=2782163 RepID=A0A7L7KT45_9MOLU|nr:branched-chain amino acid ABC transporter permease [Xianfuyuplasma coldseepsis]QMS85981.1 branched-chain amino acid ABC transporter permease [Xianfuyuplasma coldseepsis]
MNKKRQSMITSIREGVKALRHPGAFLKQHPRMMYIVFGLLYMVIAYLPHFGLIEFGTMGVFAYIAIYSIVALGLNLLLGFSGLISLSTAGFMGAGALGTGVLIQQGLPFELAAAIAVITAGAIGALIGLFSLKVEGIYLAIATLFVGEILHKIYTQVAIFGGDAIRIGAIKVFGLRELSQISQIDRTYLFILIVAILVLMMIVMHNIVHSKTGRALLAMSRSEHAAQAMGISILRYRLTAFVTATMFAATAGVAYALYFQSVTTAQWTLSASLFIIAMVVVGGYKSIYGTLLGVFIIHGIPELIIKDYLGDVSYIFSGILIIIVIIFYPNGFVYIWYDLKGWMYKVNVKQKIKNLFTKEPTNRGDSQ